MTTSLSSSPLTASRSAGARGWIAATACVAVLAGPTALAFFTGGYFEQTRVWAGLIAWALVAIAALISDEPWPRGRAALVAVAGLALMAAWTLGSLGWAPVAAGAYGSGELLVLYLGVLLAAAALVRGDTARRLLEPALTTGALIVIGYGLAGRLLPGLLHYARSVSASGRLEQPLTYWNAMGELAAIGLVLAIRVAGDAGRARGLRVAALSAAVPLGAGLYASFSRGALFACLSGLVALLVVVPTRAQLRALLAGTAAAVLGALAVAPFSGVTALAGSEATRGRQGAIALVLLVVAITIAAVAQHRLMTGEPGGSLRAPRHAGLIALAAILVFLTVAVVAGAKENTNRPLNSGVSRLTTLRSDRYAYWRVAFHAFSEDPLRGVGAGGWQVYWLRLRPYAEGAVDAHSLEIQTLAEMGIVGIALLAAFAGGIAQACRRALRSNPGLAAGSVAALVVYGVHSPLDWDWQMPALTLVAVVLAGATLGLSGYEAAPSLAAEPARTGRSVAMRAGVLLVAVLAIAWYAAIARSLHDQASIRNDLHAHPVLSHAQAASLDARVDQAAVLNPDRQIPMLKALIDFSAHEPGPAVAIARRIAGQEPDNIANWVTLEILLNGRYPALTREVRTHIRALAPAVPAAP